MLCFGVQGVMAASIHLPRNVGYQCKPYSGCPLIAQRLAEGAHRQFLTWGTHGSQGLWCISASSNG